MTQSERIACKTRHVERDAVNLDRSTTSLGSTYMLRPGTTKESF